jgi:hypothetical protein
MVGDDFKYGAPGSSFCDRLCCANFVWFFVCLVFFCSFLLLYISIVTFPSWLWQIYLHDRQVISWWKMIFRVEHMVLFTVIATYSVVQDVFAFLFCYTFLLLSIFTSVNSKYLYFVWLYIIPGIIINSLMVGNIRQKAEICCLATM